MKKIEIDGVNVSNCEFIGNIKNGFVICTSWVHNNKKSENGHWDCRENKNRYYKQIKRLEQEIEDWHIKYAGCNTANSAIQKENNKLQNKLDVIEEICQELVYENEEFVNIAKIVELLRGE